MTTERDINTIRGLVPRRPAHGHKGTFGHLFVIAGSVGFTGAAKMAGLAAYRAGAGLVTVGIPHPLARLVAPSLMEVMYLRLPGTEDETIAHDALEPALAFARDKDAVVIGPGLSRQQSTVSFILDFISRAETPLVIDADALNAISENRALLSQDHAPWILTPHPGEMARITGLSAADVQKDREGVARRMAEESASVVVLKGNRTVIAAPGKTPVVNPTGNEGMGSGGTGDVLSGILGALMAQGMPPWEAACVGVHVHGLAGDIAAERLTPRALMAGDVIEALPEAWRELETP